MEVLDAIINKGAAFYAAHPLISALLVYCVLDEFADWMNKRPRK
jgi:hypothetical protein